MGTDLAAILISSVFLGVGYVIAKFFPEASLMAAVFLIGLAILNITLALLAWLIHALKLESGRKKGGHLRPTHVCSVPAIKDKLIVMYRAERFGKKRYEASISN